MADWTGFTDEELQRLKSESGKENNSTNLKSAKIGQQKRKKVKEKMLTSSNRQRVPKDIQNSKIPDPDLIIEREDIISKSGETLPTTNGPGVKDKEFNEMVATSFTPKEEKEKNINQSPTSQTLPDSIKESNIGILSDERVAEIELSNLQILQKKQKEIEEENKKKKKIIKDTVQERLKRTQSEAHTLKQVSKELARIDEQLQIDVESLRVKIDEASFYLSNAQKRYDKAEVEFVAAKQDLFTRKENKDMLTEHLYSIIQENELKKARKLEEIMSKLNMEDTTGDTLSNESFTGPFATTINENQVPEDSNCLVTNPVEKEHQTTPVSNS